MSRRARARRRSASCSPSPTSTGPPQPRSRAGAEMTSEVGEGYGHRGATIVDPFGHRWMLQTPLPDAPAADTGDGDIEVEYRHGDIAYTSLWVPDAARAAAFFSAVLGWTFAGEPDAGHARQVLGATPAQGIFGGHERSTLFALLRGRRRRRRGRPYPRRRRRGRRADRRTVRARRRLHRRPGHAVRRRRAAGSLHTRHRRARDGDARAATAGARATSRT